VVAIRVLAALGLSKLQARCRCWLRVVWTGPQGRLHLSACSKGLTTTVPGTGMVVHGCFIPTPGHCGPVSARAPSAPYCSWQAALLPGSSQGLWASGHWLPPASGSKPVMLGLEGIERYAASCVSNTRAALGVSHSNCTVRLRPLVTVATLPYKSPCLLGHVCEMSMGTIDGRGRPIMVPMAWERPGCGQAELNPHTALLLTCMTAM